MQAPFNNRNRTSRVAAAFTFSLLLFAASAKPLMAAPFPLRSLTVNQVNRIAMEDLAAFYGMRQTVRNKTVLWQGAHGKAEFTVDRRQAKINDPIVHLSNAIDQHQEQPLISELDFRLLIDPLLRNESLPRQQVRKIVIDPGHGGRDPGASGQNHQEKEVVLQISLRLARILRNYGFAVKLTRNTDQYISLDHRVAIANAAGTDIFVSIHANSAANQSVHGIETFLLSPPGAAETYSNHVTARPHPGHRFNKQNLRLAYEIQRHVLHRSQTHDRGVKHADFQVLRGLESPGVLVEVGFLSNRREERKLADPRHQQKLAAGIAEGIIAYRQAIAETLRSPVGNDFFP